VDYKLPTHDLKDVDIKAAAANAIKNDPFLLVSQGVGGGAINQLIDSGKGAAEQQAFAKHGLELRPRRVPPGEASRNVKKFLP